MIEPIRPRGRRRVALSVLALAVAVTTCRDAPTGLGGNRGMLNIAPVFTGAMDPAAFGITIDSIRAIVIRPAADTLADRTAAFPADSSALELDLPVLLQADVETLTVHIQYRGAGLLLFIGSAQVVATTGPPGSAPPTEIPVGTYVGPGASVDSLVVTPADSILTWGDSLRFRVAAFQAGASVTQFYVSWTTTDPGTSINGAGVLHAPSRRDTIYVVARTPSDTVDSVAVSFMPLPAGIQIVSGDGQSGSTGAPLAQALRVRVTATDGGGVAFARVRFRVALGGGSVADTLVTADDRGFAQTLATLGLTVGAQAFEASLDATRFVTFNASAIAGQAVRLEFTAQPGATTAGIALSPAVQVTARDTAGSIAAGFTGPVTVALLANPGSATLGGTTTVNAVAGVASFTSLVLDRTAAGYTLLATAPSLVADTSAAFSVVSAAATQLVFTTQPASAIAGTAIPMVVTARDAFGNTATGFTGNVAIAIAANPGSGTLAGTASVPAVAGVATFATLSIDRVGTGYTLSASGGGLPAATSAAFSISPAAASQLAFTAQPTTAVAGVAIAPAVAVTVRDAFGNTVPGFAGSVTVAIAANPGSGTLTGTATAAVVSGVATFGGLSIDKVGTGYTLTATSGALSAATSAGFNITPAAASRLAITAEPTTAVAGVAIAPAVVVTARDPFGNTATGFTGTVAVAIGTNPGAGTLSGSAGVAAVAGIATFGTLSIDKVGAGYTLVATAAALVPDTSVAFGITPAAASQLVFTGQPSAVVAGVAIAPAVVVTARDPFGNTATGFTGNVVVAIGTNPGSGTLSGAATQAAIAGVATFASLSIDKVGIGYTLAATSGALTPGASAGFDVTPAAASQLAFAAQPTTAVAGVAIAPAVVVTALDPFGNTATGFTGTVAVAIGTNPGSGTLSGTASQAAAAGVATFPNLSIDKVGVGYTLAATSGVLTPGTSAAFSITPAPASQLVFTLQPTSAVAGQTSLVQVTARDAFGNIATGFTANVSLALGANPGGSTIGTPTIAAVAGIATFTNVALDKAGTGYTLVATSGALTGTSAPFDIIPAAASQLAFTTQPVTTVAGAAIPVVVTARDPFGNTATGFTGDVAVAIGTNPGGGTLSGTASVAAVGGVATFTTLSIDRIGTGYTVAATSGVLTAATSAAFNITPAPATQLAFTGQPTTAVAGVAIAPAVVVTARDQFGNTATAFAGTVSVAIGTNPASGTLSGTATQTATAGVATFANLSIDRTGTGYTLTAASGTLTGATSAGFNITPAAATQLVFTTQPTTAVAGVPIAPAVVVTARDALGNTATGFTGDVAVAIGANPGNGALSGTATRTAVGGVATFPDLSIDKAGTGYTLSASATGVAGVTSGTFGITPAPAALLILLGGSGQAAVAGSVLPGPLDVRVIDQFGNGVGAVPITWTVVSGGGTVDPLPSFTDGTGIASVLWTLGATVGSQVVQASSGSLTGSPAIFSATALPAGTTSLWVGGNATAPTDWFTAGNWQPAAVPTFSDNVFVPASAVNQPVVNSNASAGDVIVEIGASVTIGATDTLRVAGNVVAGATIAGAGTLEISGEGGSVQGTVPTLHVNGSVVASGPVTVIGDVLVTGSFTLNGQPVLVSGSFATSQFGWLQMNDPADVLAVQGDVGFHGGSTSDLLTAGVLSVNGDFTVTDTVSDRSFFASGEHTVVLGGIGVQLVALQQQFQQQLLAQFQNLEVVNTATVRPVTPVNVAGSLVVAGGAFDVNGHAVSAGTFATIGDGILRMTTGTGVLDVSGDVAFGGGNESGQLFDGVLRVGGSFIQTGTPSGGGSFEGASLHVTEFDGSDLQTISFGDPVGSHFGNVRFGNTSLLGLSFASDAFAAGQLQTSSLRAVKRVFGNGHQLRVLGLDADVLLLDNLELVVEDGFGIALFRDVQLENNDPTVAQLTFDRANGVHTFTNVSFGVTPTAGGLYIDATDNTPDGQQFTINMVNSTPLNGAAFTAMTGADGGALVKWTELAFTVQPSATSAGGPITPAVEVTVVDPFGDPVTTFGDLVSVTIGNNPSEGSLGGSTSADAVGGVAQFSDLSIDAVGIGYTLQASTTQLPTVESAAFDITSGGPAQILWAGDSANGQSKGQFRADPDGSGLFRITTEGPSNRDYPRWSPDRSRYTYTSNNVQSGTNLLHVGSVDGSELAHVVNDTSTERAAWNSTGKHLAAACGPLFSPNDVCVVANVDGSIPLIDRIGDGSGKTFVTDLGNQNRDVGPGAFHWDPANPDRLAIVRDSASTSRIYTVNVDGTGVTPLSSEVMDAGKGPLQIVGTLDWSPDGSRLAFSAIDPGSERHIYLINRDGTALTQLTTGTDAEWEPIFSPSSQEVLFLRNVGGCSVDFWAIGTNGSNERQLTEEGVCDYDINLLGADWSPDGQEIAVTGFEAPYNNQAIYRIRRTTTAATYLTERILVGRGADAAFQVTDIHPNWRP